MARDRGPAATLGVYGAVLALVFVGALGVGRAVGPLDGAPPQGGTTSSETTSTETTSTETTSTETTSTDAPSTDGHSDDTHGMSGEAR